MEEWKIGVPKGSGSGRPKFSTQANHPTLTPEDQPHPSCLHRHGRDHNKSTIQSHQLDNWEDMCLSLYGKCLLVQAIVGGHTQFLTKAQGMPPNIEAALTKMIQNFIWGETSLPCIAMEALHRPMEEGGLDLLDINVQNEAIEIGWLKSYLNFNGTHPT